MSTILTRAVILHEDRLLIVRSKGSTHFFLPGGHVESGEPLEDCLKRELREELGVSCTVGTYLGRVEHSWTRKETIILETNHCFVVALADHEVTSTEHHLEFTWLPVSEISSTDLRPPALRSLITRFLLGDSTPWNVLLSSQNPTST